MKDKTLVQILVATAFFITNDSTLKIFGQVNLFSILIFLLFPFRLYKYFKINTITLFFIFATFIYCFLIIFLSLHKIDNNYKYYEWAQGLNDPYIRGYTFLLRLFITFFCFNILLNFSTVNSFRKSIDIVLINGSFLLAVTLLVQFILKVIFNFDFLYFNYELDGTYRLGAWVGEPQTVGLLQIPGFLLILINFIKKELNRNDIFKLIIIFISFYFTSSSATILAILACILIIFIYKFNVISKKISFSILFILTTLLPFLTTILYSKINQDLMNVSLRSITVIAGAELLIKNFFWGLGIGLSPFYLENTSIFFDESQFNLISIYRQNIMCTPIEMLVELGIVGVILYLSVFKFFLKNKYKYDLELSLPMIGVIIISFAVGSIFYSPIFIIVLSSSFKNIKI